MIIFTGESPSGKRHDEECIRIVKQFNAFILKNIVFEKEDENGQSQSSH